MHQDEDAEEAAYKQRMEEAAKRMSAIDGMDDLLAELLEGEQEEAEEEVQEEGEEEQEEVEADQAVAKGDSDAPPEGSAEEEEVETFECKAGDDVGELGPAAFPPDPVEIYSVTQGSWAAGQGVAEGDILVAMNGQSVPDKKEQEEVEAGQGVAEGDILVAMNGQSVPDKKEQEQVEADQAAAKAGSDAPPEGSAEEEEVETFECKAGDDVGELGPAAFPPDPAEIYSVTQGSWAAGQGVAEGDILVAMNGQSVPDKKEQEEVEADQAVAKGGSDAPPDGSEEEEEVETFECKAGDDVGELGLFPAAFPPDPVEIYSVTPGSWAAGQGVAEGDILVAINGQPVPDKKDMKRLMRERPLRLTFQRLLAYETPEESADETTAFECRAGQDVQDLGIYPSAFPPDPMLVASVTPGSWAATQGVVPGDEFVEIGGHQVKGLTAKEAKRAMRERPLKLVFHRSDRAESSPAPTPTSPSPAPKPRKSKPPAADDVLTQARKSLAALIPEGMNPLSSAGSKLDRMRWDQRIGACTFTTPCLPSRAQELYTKAQISVSTCFPARVAAELLGDRSKKAGNVQGSQASKVGFNEEARRAHLYEGKPPSACGSCRGSQRRRRWLGRR